MNTFKTFLGAVSLAGFFLPVVAAQADMFGSDKENWDRVFVELKKINTRLVESLDNQMKSLQTSQANVQSQINTVKDALTELRGMMEQSEARMSGKVGKIEGKVLELDGKLKYELDDLKKNQRESSAVLRGEMLALLEKLKQNLAMDLENMAKINQKSNEGLARSTGESLTAIVAAINNFQTSVSSNIAASQATSASGFANIDANNKKMIEILSRALQENQAVSVKTDALAKNLQDVNANIGLTRETIAKLKEIMGVKLDNIGKDHVAVQAQFDQNLKTLDLLSQNLRVADEKSGKLAEGLRVLQTQNANLGTALTSLNDQVGQVRGASQATNEKFNKLIDSSREIAVHSSQIEAKLDQSMQKTEPGLANIDLANEKLGKLIEILKTMALEQGKMEQNARGQQERIDQIVKSQAEMAEMIEELRKKSNSSHEVKKAPEKREKKAPSAPQEKAPRKAPAER
ncbi:MAG: hypothetical protein HY579_07910 [Nitrospinae bacterium]|nr:hypothetical protein [Nitrospinota bacterium]